uniref:polyphenol oxidase I, chloroplastic-like n=1 Tax=Erigeron canadensis TaxID=72917 RepID=UPI001CB8BACE|nr:polyphenol oxidase I, chloroplastic-like [Erigeron canadensis]
MSCLLLTSSFTTTTHSKPNTFKTRTNKNRGLRVSCNKTPTNDDNQIILPETQKLIMPNVVDRRDLLVGLGGLCTAGNLSSLSSALAIPISTPDDITSKCQDASIKSKGDIKRTLKCCPPSLGKTVKPFEFPKGETVRMRWPAHEGTNEQVDKYKKAIQAMRALPDDHPHSFKQQASIHCAYCNGGYTQVVGNGFPDIKIDVHNSWLFFPFHRWYLYFYERILGKLIDDPTFALPYWNWDDPSGMQIPKMFLFDENENNPLYDDFRDKRHQPPQLVNLALKPNQDKDLSNDQEKCNLFTVYRDLVSNANNEIDFFGGKYVAGAGPNDPKPSTGSVERSSHTAVHLWVGDSSLPNREDMGNFYSAGYDPLFYVHHANVDRMWKLWKDLRPGENVEPTDNDWLNASYVFYDENQDVVRVYNKDSVDIRKLKFDYAKSDINKVAWRKSRPRRRDTNEQAPSLPVVKSVNEETFPVKLDKILKYRVTRPKRTNDQKAADCKELLSINGIKYRGDKFVKFDVFVNDKVNTKDDKLPTPCDPEYAGGFAQVPHCESVMFMVSAARFGLDELLEDTNTKGEEYVVVALVPRTGTEDLTVGEIKIELCPVV